MPELHPDPEHTVQARAALRRIRVTGFDHERTRGKPTFNELRAELGEGNAQHLVVQVGEQLLAAKLDKTGFPLHVAVSHVIQRMSDDDRRRVAHGEVPPVLAAIAAAVVDFAKDHDKKTEIQAAAAEHRENSHAESRSACAAPPPLAAH
ncbi:MAG: hypothetical protein WDN31_02580 [Hyphomicrobium sp.]